MINSNIFSPFVSPSERNTIKKKPSRKAAALQNTPLRKRTQLLPHKSHIHLLTFTCRGDLNARPTQNATITSQNPIKARRHATPRVFPVHPQVHWVPRGGEGAAPGGWSGGQRGRECVCARQIDPGRSLRLRASAPGPPSGGPTWCMRAAPPARNIRFRRLTWSHRRFISVIDWLGVTGSTEFERVRICYSVLWRVCLININEAFKVDE